MSDADNDEAHLEHRAATDPVTAFAAWIYNFNHTDPDYPPPSMLVLNGMENAVEQLDEMVSTITRLRHLLRAARDTEIWPQDLIDDVNDALGEGPDPDVCSICGGLIPAGDDAAAEELRCLAGEEDAHGGSDDEGAATPDPSGLCFTCGYDPIGDESPCTDCGKYTCAECARAGHACCDGGST